LAARLEVNLRTVERDIARLRDMFAAPIEYDRSRGGYRYSEPFEMPPMRLTEGEAITVFLGQRLLSQCRGTPFEDLVRKALTKIRMMLPQEIEGNLERALDSVSFHAEPLRGEEIEAAHRYQLLAQAIQDRRTVVVDYYTASRQAQSKRRIDPCHLRLVDGAWYCIGYCQDRREMRTFALDRMSQIEVTSDVFQVPAGFTIEEYLSDSLAIERGELRRVVIEFDSAAAPYVLGRQWHRSQVLEELPGGALRMSLRIGGLGEVRRWVMSLGSSAWVVEPDDLRAQIVAQLEAARRRY
jgi:predicted DNA-binding transcriptional regulator YafY